MCGRTTLVVVDVEELRQLFDLNDVPAMVPRYNIAPTQPLPVIRTPGRLELLPWSTKERRVINVRLTNASTKPSGRCLVVVDGFYEWRQPDKTPFYFHRADKKPFALGGVVLGQGDGASAAIVTTSPEPGIADIHDRMPLILARDARKAWLDGVKPAATLAGFERYEVSSWVNAAKNDDPKCVEPSALAQTL